ncbi:MAG: alpha-L-fucosidase [Bacteroidales bacterium]|nr:alpha-L-fucosidase [Bacteroidales bacterium]
MKKYGLFATIALALTFCACRNEEPQPYGAVPTEAQMEWQRMETNMFCHFGPNTFTGEEWGNGGEDEDLFYPTEMDCRQWVAVAKAAGMKGIIITAKHHDGFCLWPSNESNHTVRESRWQRGSGDVLRDLSEACREGGLKFGVYVSPWDRNAPNYGTAEYNQTFARTLQEVLGGYGEVFEQWFDGANGEGPNGRKQEYDWALFNRTVGELQPQAVVFSDVGPGCRWIGNEQGEAGRTCWSTLNPEGYEPGRGPAEKTLNEGEEGGKCWIPGEADVSIRKGWFYKESEHPKSVAELTDIYLKSVGRNAVMLLNVPPDTRGLIAAEDSTRLMEWRATLDKIFGHDLCEGATAKADSRWGKKYDIAGALDGDKSTCWVAKKGRKEGSVTITLPEERRFNLIMLQEEIGLGQRVAEFTIEAEGKDGRWHEIAKETTIGYKRIVPVPDTESRRIRIRITRSLAEPTLKGIGLFWYDQF